MIATFTDLQYDYEELEQEIKAYVAQLISLVQTIMSQSESVTTEDLFLDFT